MEKRVAIYCRLDKGGDSETAKNIAHLQENYLIDFASKHGYSVFEIYSDIGYAGHDLTRPEFLRMLRDAEKGAFDAILTTNHNRLYRGDIAAIPPIPVPVIALDGPNRWIKRCPIR